MLTDADFARARVEATQTFAIQAFIPARELDHLYAEHPYYLAPSGKGASHAYALLRDALDKAGRVGIGTIVLRQREHLAALEPTGQALTLTTMRFAHEIRPPAALELPRGGRYAKKELALADQLIEALAAPWNPQDYRDTYTDVLKQVIKDKIAGKAVSPAPKSKRPAQVIDLAEALRESLKASRGGAGERKTSRKSLRRPGVTPRTSRSGRRAA